MRFISGRLIIGLFIITLGVLSMLRIFGVDVEVSKVWFYWPVIPLVLGFNWLILSFRTTDIGEGKKMFFSWGQFITAIIAIAVGVFYLGDKFGYFQNINTGDLWNAIMALVLVGVGFSLIRGRAVVGRSGGRFAFMSGVEEGGNASWKLENGNYFAFMGGIDLDLTRAEIPMGVTVLDLTAFMGGIDVKIPKDLAIVYDGSAFLGGVSFKGHEEGGVIAGRKIEHNVTEESERVVHIQARAIMGGIDIKEAL